VNKEMDGVCEVVMPQMGDKIAEGTITRWLVEVGDRVDRDQPLFEIATDKVDAEIPSPASGVLQVLYPVGATVPVNTVVARIVAFGDHPETSPRKSLIGEQCNVELRSPGPEGQLEEIGSETGRQASGYRRITRGELAAISKRLGRERLWRNLISIPLAVYLTFKFPWGVYLVLVYILLRVNNASAELNRLYSMHLATYPEEAGSQGSESELIRKAEETTGQPQNPGHQADG
jgi:pyruvate/2-oxoglutarate dehydrogenase complex dihydrolipoamide acyltransferase (E2) component